MKIVLRFVLLFLIPLLASCSQKEQVDLIVHHGKVYLVDSSFQIAEAFAVKDGKFVATGSNEEILNQFSSDSTVDAVGKFIFPGFIDSHCHFYGYGKGLQELDLVGTQSFDEVLEKLKAYATNHSGSWLIGRGWDQNDWNNKQFPNRFELDKLFPNTPVFLERIDGHAALVNAAAFKKAGINGLEQVSGGRIEAIPYPYDDENNKGQLVQKEGFVLSGILIDNAVDLVKKVIPAPTSAEIAASLLAAEKKCVAVGLTTVDDAGLDRNVIHLIDSLQQQGFLKMRVYAMVSDNADNLKYYLKTGPYKTDRLNVRSFKYYADGALGSRGACLLQPYTDQQDRYGLLLSPEAHFDSAAVLMQQHGFQMNTHCIGDSAVRLISHIYMQHLISNGTASAPPLMAGWRIEHAQVVDPADLPKFSGIIPSVQPTHATSDMYWAKDRLGEKRIKHAYAYSSLLKKCGIIALGTDFPVENINPFFTFYAATSRMDQKGFPVGGFQPEEALSREQTLRGMTIWGAVANFEEKEKGSIQPGKWADFIILDQDIMECPYKDIPNTKVQATYINGQLVYSKK